MNEIRIFENEEFGSLRTFEENGRILFCGSDVAKALKYAKPSNAVSAHCRCTLKRGIPHPQSPNKIIDMIFISEGDVYRLISHSRLPAAEEFESWIFDDILPTIRKTGGYVSDADRFVDNYLSFADKPIRDLFKLQFQYIGQLSDRIKKDEPKVRFADHVASTENVIDMNAMAKLCADHGIRIGRTRLFAWLRSRGILMTNNLPYQEYVERGYCKVKESVYECKGIEKTYQQTYVTGKGQQYILNRLLNEFGGE